MTYKTKKQKLKIKKLIKKNKQIEKQHNKEFRDLVRQIYNPQPEYISPYEIYNKNSIDRNGILGGLVMK